MSIFLTIIPLFLGVLLLCFKKFKTATAFVLISAFSLFFIGTGLLPSVLLNQLQRSFVTFPSISWKNNNLIVVLGGGLVKDQNTDVVTPGVMSYSRIYETARLYFSCVTQKNRCQIMISGGDPQHNGTTEADAYRNLLLSLTINPDDILIEPESKNTYQNAHYVSVFIKKNEFDQIVLVTSKIHLKRSLLYFSHFNITPTPAAADILYPRITLLPMAYNFALNDFALHEYVGILRYYMYTFLGLNKES